MGVNDNKRFPAMKKQDIYRKLKDYSVFEVSNAMWLAIIENRGFPLIEAKRIHVLRPPEVRKVWDSFDTEYIE